MFKTLKQIEKEERDFKQHHSVKWRLKIIDSTIRRWTYTTFNVAQYCREIKWFIQRGSRGWSDQDAWNLFSYNSRVMSEALNYLSQITNGYPEEYTYKRWKIKLKATSCLFDAIYREEGLNNKQYRKIIKKLCKIIEKDYIHWWY